MSAGLPKNVGLRKNGLRKNGLRKSVLQRSLVGASVLLSLAGCDAGGNGGPPVVEPGSAIGSQPGAGGSSNPDTTIPGSGGAGGPGGGTEWTSQCASPELGAPGLRRLTRRELEQTLRDIFPSLGAAWTSALSADSLGSSGFDNDNELLVVSKQAAREIATTAETVGENLAAAQASLLPCAAGSEATCAGQFLDVQGRRLFRRPLTATERSTFLTFWNTAFTATGSFAQSVGWLSRALIESPEFVYRREIGTADGGSQRLDQFEIASELAYTFSGTAPSNELLDRAGRGELSSPQVLVQTARELLNTSGRGVVQSFFDAYVGHARITTIAKAGVPGFAEQREAMLEETRHFIEEVVFNRGGGVRELLTADFTTPSRALAAFYEFTGDSLPASDYQVVPRPEGHGIGLLAQGSVLATLAQPNGSSPTKRGLWIFKHLLCNSVPPVPPNIPELKPPVEGQITTRQRYAEQHATGACQGCHSRWDPIGFGFEHFNEAGQYREKEGGLDIDTSSHVPQAGQTLFEFDGQEDLVTQLAELPLVHECLSGYLATYAFGEELTCAADSQRGAFISGEIGVLDYLASLAGEPHFTQRAIE